MTIDNATTSAKLFYFRKVVNIFEKRNIVFNFLNLSIKYVLVGSSVYKLLVLAGFLYFVEHVMKSIFARSNQTLFHALYIYFFFNFFL